MIGFECKVQLYTPSLSRADMSNSIEPAIDIDFFRGIDIGIGIGFSDFRTIDIGIDIDFLAFGKLTLVLTLTFFRFNVNG